MANGVIPPPGGASPLPQVTAARGGGRRGGEGPQGGEGSPLADLGTPTSRDGAGLEGMGKGRAFRYFSVLLPPLLASSGRLGG